ncbi:hypothetical protein [Spiroplasma endosymbiont of Labia minor]|uniref:hypothetical protein n=1 Tax=Spiroplasma endosymbiont of Labia minor TaxID=3066305 RepID=UPI0030D35C9D
MQPDMILNNNKQKKTKTMLAMHCFSVIFSLLAAGVYCFIVYEASLVYTIDSSDGIMNGLAKSPAASNIWFVTNILNISSTQIGLLISPLYILINSIFVLSVLSIIFESISLAIASKQKNKKQLVISSLQITISLLVIGSAFYVFKWFYLMESNVSNNLGDLSSSILYQWGPFDLNDDQIIKWSESKVDVINPFQIIVSNNGNHYIVSMVNPKSTNYLFLFLYLGPVIYSSGLFSIVFAIVPMFKKRIKVKMAKTKKQKNKKVKATNKLDATMSDEKAINNNDMDDLEEIPQLQNFPEEQHTKNSFSEIDNLNNNLTESNQLNQETIENNNFYQYQPQQSPESLTSEDQMINSQYYEPIVDNSFSSSNIELQQSSLSSIPITDQMIISQPDLMTNNNFTQYQPQQSLMSEDQMVNSQYEPIVDNSFSSSNIELQQSSLSSIPITEQVKISQHDEPTVVTDFSQFKQPNLSSSPVMSETNKKNKDYLRNLRKNKKINKQLKQNEINKKDKFNNVKKVNEINSFSNQKRGQNLLADEINNINKHIQTENNTNKLLSDKINRLEQIMLSIMKERYEDVLSKRQLSIEERLKEISNRVGIMNAEVFLDKASRNSKLKSYVYNSPQPMRDANQHSHIRKILPNGITICEYCGQRLE